MQNVIKDLGKPFWLVWALELWERFGYYGVNSILAIYFVKQLGYSEETSFKVFGSYTALCYGFIWLGGIIGDRYFGNRRTMALGAFVLFLSYLAISFSTKQTIYYALALQIVGNSLFKSNPTILISKMYKDNGSSLDSAMTMYYMAINIGSLISMSLTPIIAQNIGWNYAFFLCAIGLFLGLLTYNFYKEILYKNQNIIDEEEKEFYLPKLCLLSLGIVLSTIFIAGALNYNNVCDIVIYVICALSFCYFLMYASKLQQKEKLNMYGAFILIIQAVVFFVLYNQMFTSLTFFAIHNINNVVFGFNVPPAEYQVLNALVIIVFSPILAHFYLKHKIDYVDKFIVGMILCSLGFASLSVCRFFNDAGLVSPWWLVCSYTFQSVGELLISGLGLSMVSNLCPKRITGFVMGAWFLAIMLSGPISGAVASLVEVPNGDALTKIQTLNIYSKVFFEIGFCTFLIASSMIFFRKKVKYMIS